MDDTLRNEDLTELAQEILRYCKEPRTTYQVLERFTGEGHWESFHEVKGCVETLITGGLVTLKDNILEVEE